jgi:hypothetical protein
MPKPSSASLLKQQQNLFALKKLRQQDNPIELQILAARLPKPVMEYQFATTLGRQWAADYAWPEYRILFEVEGAAFGNAVHVGTGAWTTRRKGGQSIRVALEPGTVVRLGGRHNSGVGMQADCEKYSQASILGWIVVRATTTMIRDGYAIGLIEAAFEARRREGYPK